MKKFTSWPGTRAYDPEDKVNFKLVTRDIDGQKVDVIFRKGHPGVTPAKVAELRAAGQMPAGDRRRKGRHCKRFL